MISVHLGISKLNITELNELKEPLAIRNDEVSGSIPLSSTIGFPLDVMNLVRFNVAR